MFKTTIVRSLAVALALATMPAISGCEEDVGTGDEQNVTATSNARIETFQGLDGQYYFNVFAGNNEQVLRSEGYTTLAGAEKGVESVKNNGVDTDNYDLLQAVDGSHYFNLVAQNGEIIGTSEMYVSKTNAERGMKATRDVLASVNRLEAAATGGAKFEVFKGLDSKYYFHLRAGNGEIVLQSQSYTSKQNAKKGVSSVRTNGGDEVNYEIREAQNDQTYFVLKAGNGQIIARGETYVSESNAERAIEDISDLIASEKIADPQ